MKEKAMDLREQRGMHIAANCRITHQYTNWGHRYFVPSASQDGHRYTVSITPDDRTCTCPDFEERQMTCKHIHAVLFTIKREKNADGSTTVTETMTVSETVEKTVQKRTTYKQDWP